MQMGISSTNDPSVRVQWEQEGRIVSLVLLVDRLAPSPQPMLPWVRHGDEA